MENHGGDIPKTIEEIVALPGVGPKMGFLLYKVVGVLTPELVLMFICIDWRSCGAGFLQKLIHLKRLE